MRWPMIVAGHQRWAARPACAGSGAHRGAGADPAASHWFEKLERAGIPCGLVRSVRKPWATFRRHRRPAFSGYGR
jgi:hypothetical protein